MGLFDSFNPFDPGGLFGGGGGPGGGDGAPAGGDSSGGGVAVVPGADSTKDEQPLDVQKAYGFGVAGTGGGATGGSKFDQMRRQQMGMGGSSQGG